MHLFLVGLLFGSALVARVESVQGVAKSAGNITYDGQDVALKSPAELIRLRGFQVEEHFAHTKDGYYINVVRIVNPKWLGHALKRPVLFNHGLLESATIWLMSSLGVSPARYPNRCGMSLNESLHEMNRDHFVNGPMLLSNLGHDVWLMSMRGTDMSLRHDLLSHRDPRFWNYCLDDFGLVDVPTVVDYIRRATGAAKIGYVGHSQATFSVFALLSTRPRYATILEPVVAVAPVSYFDHTTSIGRRLFLGTFAATGANQHAPFPRNPPAVRQALGHFCQSPSESNRDLCQLLDMLISGRGKKLPAGYFTHLPYTTSLKVLRQFGQLIHYKRFMMYDYGLKANREIYGTHRAPGYPIERIRSRSICLIYTKSDALSPPKDVQQFKDRLKVPLFRDIFIDGEFNHFDLIADPGARHLVFYPIAQIFDEFERNSDNCNQSTTSEPMASGKDLDELKNQEKALFDLEKSVGSGKELTDDIKSISEGLRNNTQEQDQVKVSKRSESMPDNYDYETYQAAPNAIIVASNTTLKPKNQEPAY